MPNILEIELITQIKKLPNYKNAKYLVSYSGGIDSTALLIAAHKIFKKLGINNLSAVFFSHINSPINEGESDNLVLVKKVCSELNIPLDTRELDLSQKGNHSWEQYGRMLRQQYFFESSFDFVLLGHHREDQDETTLIQLFRGAGKGVAGMKSLDNKLFRPFLNLSKKDLKSYLIEKNIPWLDDPTNANNDLTRNFWRNEGIPTIQKHYPHISSQIQVIRDKFNEQEEIAFELAKIDGLDDFLKNEHINLQCSIVRVLNLISFTLNHYGVGVQKRLIKEQLESYWLKKDFIFKANEKVTFFISKNGNILIKHT